MRAQLEDGLNHFPLRVASIQPFVAVGFVLLFAAFPLLPGNMVIATAGVITVLTIVGWNARWDVAVPLGCFCVTCMVLALLGLPSQLWFALGLGGYLLMCKSVRWLHGTPGWLRAGFIRGDVVLLTIVSVLLAGTALIVWFVSVRPNVTDIIETFVPKWNVLLLILGGLLFSMVNAAVEEGAYRGVIMDALDRSIGCGTAPLIFQAAAFGTLHIHGFPRGWIGVGLAFVFGLLMGLTRRRGEGMLAPWIAHVCADIIIVGIVVILARTA
jgi:membrane protease YdiL (CAAX protease family)